MQVFDASSIIYAWDNYPIEQFPILWKWLAERVQQGAIQMPQVAVEEVGHKYPECANWLSQAGLHKLPVNEVILLEALRIKHLLGIEDKYGSGVDENDLFIIATAKAHDCELVTDESFQLTPNKLKANWKIPAVCRMDDVRVTCTSFLSYLKRSKVVFG
ncbi:DUF4411 family protein [Aeromonas enteropelogenes]|uniref:DUF4411 family protein n=1 Tax=Aeromonas enteropelogenes TaxID=29489 RepID=UPI0038D04031